MKEAAFGDVAMIREVYSRRTLHLHSSPGMTGVTPLEAGKGSSFLLRRLHSLSGIFPIAAFLMEYFFSNAFALNGSNAYNDNVRFLVAILFIAASSVTMMAFLRAPPVSKAPRNAAPLFFPRM